MEQRKIQLSGRTTHVVSLPKRWVEAAHLEVGDPVLLDIADDGTLRVIPDTDRRNQRHTIKIEAEGMPGIHLQRMLLAAYQCGYGAIEITARERITPDQKQAVRTVLGRTAGLEVVEERPRTMVLADLVDPKQFASRQGIQRLRHIVVTMVRDALEAVRTNDTDLAKDVEDRDDAVDRVYLMVANQHVQLIGDLTLARRKQLTLRGSLFLMLVARALERCGDHGVRIARTLEETGVDRDDIDQATWTRLDELADESLQLLHDAVEAFLRGDSDTAHAVITRSDAITADRPRLTRSLARGSQDADMAVGLIVEPLERLHQYAADIAETALAETLVRKEDPARAPKRSARDVRQTCTGAEPRHQSVSRPARFATMRFRPGMPVYRRPYG